MERDGHRTMDNFDLASFLKDLETLVNIDSGSRHPEGTRKVADFFRERYAAMGWQVKEKIFSDQIGPCLEISNKAAETYDVLLIGHMDTVFPVGTAEKRPFRTEGNHAYGPGVTDMKAGLLYIYYALQSLQDSGNLQRPAICVAMNSDEEISSLYSRPWLEELSKQSHSALVLESAPRACGGLVNKRKGVGRYSLEFTGRAAHSGAEHEKGISAVNELCHWTLALHNLTNYPVGTTVNVGLISGGTSVNTVAEHATAEMDVRISLASEATKIEKLMTEMAANPRTPGVRVSVKGGITRPPMNPSEQTLVLCSAVSKIAAELNIKAEWVESGGASDGNFSAALGVPTLDGLGPVGGGDHSPDEFLLLDSLGPRFNLLCEIIRHLTQPV